MNLDIEERKDRDGEEYLRGMTRLGFGGEGRRHELGMNWLNQGKSDCGTRVQRRRGIRWRGIFINEKMGAKIRFDGREGGKSGCEEKG